MILKLRGCVSALGGILILGASSTLHWTHLSVCVCVFLVGKGLGVCVEGTDNPGTSQSWGIQKCDWVECTVVFETANTHLISQCLWAHSSIVVTLFIYWLHPGFLALACGSSLRHMAFSSSFMAPGSAWAQCGLPCSGLVVLQHVGSQFPG